MQDHRPQTEDAALIYPRVSGVSADDGESPRPPVLLRRALKNGAVSTAIMSLKMDDQRRGYWVVNGKSAPLLVNGVLLSYESISSTSIKRDGFWT